MTQLLAQLAPFSDGTAIAGFRLAMTAVAVVTVLVIISMMAIRNKEPS